MPLGHVRHGAVVEAALDLVVGEFYEGVVLFGQLGSQRLVVLLAQRLLPLAH